MRPRTVVAAPLPALGTRACAGWSGLCVRLAGAVCTVVPADDRSAAGSVCRERCYVRVPGSAG